MYQHRGMKGQPMTEYTIGVVLFEGFEILDACGPIELFGMHPEKLKTLLVSQSDREVESAQGPRFVADHTFSNDAHFDILLVPGGPGTRREVNNKVMMNWLIDQSKSVKYLTSVCTGSVLLARSGLLNGVRATSNKMSFDWVAAHGPDVKWVREARWVEDGHILTSSGVSAGMDMSLALIEILLGKKSAKDAALWAEYERHEDSTLDPFAHLHGIS